MKLLCKLLVGVGLDAERFPNGKHLEQKWEFASKPLADFCRQQGLVVLNQVEEGTLRLNILRGKRRMRAHPELVKRTCELITSNVSLDTSRTSA